MAQIIKGTGTAIVTPFKKSGVVDENALRNLVEWQVKSKVEFLVPCGSTGEAATLTRGERRRIIEIVLDQVNGRIPVIAGTGTNSTTDSLLLTKDAKETGIDTVLAVSPYYNKPTPEGIFQHYRAIAEECNIKVVMYNVPARTSSNMLAETTLRLAEEVKNIVAIKEASGNLEQVMQIIKHKPNTFSVLSGEDTLTLPIVIAGGQGVICTSSNEVPKEFGELTRFALSGDIPKARAMHYKLFNLMRANFYETNPIPVKTALSLMGKIEDNFRLPLVQMGKANKDRLKKVLKELKLI